MRVSRALFCLSALLAGLLPARAAFDLAEAKQLIVKYRHQWLGDPDRIREARIGEVYDLPFIGTAVCVAIDRGLETGSYTGLEPLVLVSHRRRPHSTTRSRPRPRTRVAPMRRCCRFRNCGMSVAASNISGRNTSPAAGVFEAHEWSGVCWASRAPKKMCSRRKRCPG
jgi:hypothetical protein